MASDTVAQQAFRRVAQKQMKDPVWARFYADLYGDMTSGECGEWLDVLHQTWGEISIWDAYPFGALAGGIALGEIWYAGIPLGNEPAANRNDDENNKGLPQGTIRLMWTRPGEEREYSIDVKSEFSPYSHGSDGYVAIDGTMPFFVGINGKTEWVDLTSAYSFPLEVGYCPAPQAWERLFQTRRIARWPYGHKELTLLYVPAHCMHKWEVDF